jgi:hypothetical protein
MSQGAGEEAELASQVRSALAQAESSSAPAFDRLWRAAGTPRPRPRLRWQPVALSLSMVVLAAAWWLHGSLAPSSDQQLRQWSAATEKQVWRDPFGGISAGIPAPVDGRDMRWPNVKYPLVPEQRYL